VQSAVERRLAVAGGTLELLAELPTIGKHLAQRVAGDARAEHFARTIAVPATISLTCPRRAFLCTPAIGLSVLKLGSLGRITKTSLLDGNNPCFPAPVL
jgi:hypothetical protein